MLDFLQWWFGAIVWLVANVVYVNMKRNGLRGFTRLAAFWVGTPTTWIALFALKEGTQPRFERPDDDDTTLLEEIRRDRLRRGERSHDGGLDDG